MIRKTFAKPRNINFTLVVFIYFKLFSFPDLLLYLIKIIDNFKTQDT